MAHDPAPVANLRHQGHVTVEVLPGEEEQLVYLFAGVSRGGDQAGQSIGEKRLADVGPPSPRDSPLRPTLDLVHLLVGLPPGPDHVNVQ